MQKLYTIRMVSDLLNKHYNTTARWLRQGAFPNASKIRGGWFIPEGDIRRLLRAGRTHAADLRMGINGPAPFASAETRSALATPARIPHKAR
jgi:hypothetical protein